MGERTSWAKVRWTWGKAAVAASWVVLTGLGFWWGRVAALSQATAAPPVTRAQVPAQPAPEPPPNVAPTAEYTGQVVAYVFGNVPITRQDLGEYLIARQGADKLDLLINKRVMEIVCQRQGIECTQAEVEKGLAEDLKALGGASAVPEKDFVEKVLKGYGKTLYEWKEDVIRPRILMGKLVASRVSVTPEDLKKAFDAYHGERFDGRIILWPKTEREKEIAFKMYGTIRESEEAFATAARQQANIRLAAAGGKIPPFGHNTTGDPILERVAFALQPGQISEIVETPQGYVVLMCDRRLAADATANLEAERGKLEDEILRKKIDLAIPTAFQEMRAQANPKKLFGDTHSQAEIQREVKKELQENKMLPPDPPPPQGN
jgi:parvulin-like peptidyl-prolyl isomerase